MSTCWEFWHGSYGDLTDGNRHGNGNRVNENGRKWRFCFQKKIPAPSDLYQIDNNLLIEFKIAVALAGYHFITIRYHLYEYVQISTCLLCCLISPVAQFVCVDLLTQSNLCSVSLGNENGEWMGIGSGSSDGNGNAVGRNLDINGTACMRMGGNWNMKRIPAHL